MPYGTANGSLSVNGSGSLQTRNSQGAQKTGIAQGAVALNT